MSFVTVLSAGWTEFSLVVRVLKCRLFTDVQLRSYKSESWRHFLRTLLVFVRRSYGTVLEYALQTFPQLEYFCSSLSFFQYICVHRLINLPASSSCFSHNMVSKPCCKLRADILFAQVRLEGGNYFTVPRAFLDSRPEGNKVGLFHDIWWRQHACQPPGEYTVIGSHALLQKAPTGIYSWWSSVFYQLQTEV